MGRNFCLCFSICAATINTFGKYWLCWKGEKYVRKERCSCRDISRAQLRCKQCILLVICVHHAMATCDLNSWTTARWRRSRKHVSGTHIQLCWFTRWKGCMMSSCLLCWPCYRLHFTHFESSLQNDSLSSVAFHSVMCHTNVTCGSRAKYMMPCLQP